jgi:hypothetical protein
MSRSNFRQTAPERPQPHIAVIAAGLPASSSRPASARRRPGRSTRLRELYSRTIRSKSAMVCRHTLRPQSQSKAKYRLSDRVRKRHRIPPATDRTGQGSASDPATAESTWCADRGDAQSYGRGPRGPRDCTQGESASSRSSACAGGGEVRTRSRQRRCRHLMRLLGTLLLACRE